MAKIDELIAVMDAPNSTDEVVVCRAALREALERFLSGHLTRDQLVSLAQRLEADDRFSYEVGHARSIADVLFAVSSPEIHEPLTPEAVRRLIVQLS